MVRCPNCGKEIAGDARFCPHCGAEQPADDRKDTQMAPTFTSWGLAPLAETVDGAAVLKTEPVTGPPLSRLQVLLTVGGVLFVILAVVLITSAVKRHAATTAATSQHAGVPVIGKMREVVAIGGTSVMVDFTDTADSFDGKSPKRGKFFAVGLIYMNSGKQEFRLSNAATCLTNAGKGERFTPILSAWGSPEQLKSGEYPRRYLREYRLMPTKAAVGIIVFDVPASLATPHLLVKDLTGTAGDFTGAVDLTKQAGE